MGLLESPNSNDFAENYIPLVKRGGADLVSDPSHHKQEVDYFMYSFIDNQEDEFTKQFVKEKVDVPSLFLLDDIAYVSSLPIYEKYEDDYDLEDVIFQQYNEIIQSTYHSYREKSIGSAGENSLPLCFVAFKLLKENSKIIIEENESMLMQNHTKPTTHINKILQLSSHVIGDPITCYV